MTLQQQILDQLVSNPKITIIDVFKGTDAVKKAEMLFFHDREQSKAKKYS